ncbi:MAG: tryptophan synthase subunit alpha [Thermodesulfobacteriota bacterium]|nr:tryptophan synthase subunit alpha [Thermodesulfobacteriota bacterium]
MLKDILEKRLQEKEILLMTHIVLGYPSFEECFEIIGTMVRSGVDLMELQIPFSEPIADGPVILHANQKSLFKGATVKKCFDFCEKVTQAFEIPFLFMSYYNILFKYGIRPFVERMADTGLTGVIVPDLPPEEGTDYLDAMKEHDLAPVFIFSPNTSDSRMKYIASFGRGFIYCVARKGVTGVNTDFSGELDLYLKRCRKATDLPLALGFGVQDKSDIDFLKGKVDIAVIGSQTIRLIDREGIGAVEGFIKELKE